MRKLWFLVMMMLLTACGGGGGGDVGFVSQSGGTGILKVQTGTLAVNQTTGKTAALFAPQPQYVRVVVHKAGFTSVIQDVQLGTSPTFILPVGTGYLVDCISFATNGVINRVLQYGVAATNASGGLAITDGATTAITVSGADIAAPTVNMPLVAGPSGSPDGLYAGDTYTVSPANLSSSIPTPLQANFNVAAQAAADFTAYPHVGITPAASPSMKAPNAASTSPTTVYILGEFYINPAFLNTDENQINWVINSPVSSGPYPMYVHGGSITGGGFFDDTYLPNVASFSAPAVVHSPVGVNITIDATDNVRVAGYLVTESATTPTAKPASGATGWQATSSFIYPFAAPLAPGASTNLWAWAKDPSGNVSDIPAAGLTVTYDSTPEVLSFSMPAGALTTAQVTPISITAGSSAPGGITGYQITQSSTPPSSWLPWTSGASPMTGLSYDITGLTPNVSTFKNVTLYAWVQDAIGISKPFSSFVVYDTRPVVDTFTADPAVQTTNTVAVTALTGTSYATPNALQYLITTAPAKPTAASLGWAVAASWTSFTFATQPAAGTRVKLNVWALDSNGVVSTSSKSAIVQY